MEFGEFIYYYGVRYRLKEIKGNKAVYEVEDENFSEWTGNTMTISAEKYKSEMAVLNLQRSER